MKQLCLGLITMLAISFSTPGLGQRVAQGLVAIEENGHKVFVNADAASQPETKLAYWSSVEHRWKAVPARGSAAMNSAESAVAEVQRELGLPQSKSRSNTVSANPSRPDLNSLIEEAAARHNVDANLVRAVIKVESNFNPNAISPKGAMGLMQLMPATARSLNVTNPFDPQQNVDAGVRHLKSLLETNSGDVQRSLAAYNAGQGAVQRNRGIPPYAETRNYVRQITHLYTNSSSSGNSLSWTPISRPVRIAQGASGTTFSNVY